jgi:cullin-associated NEDD8-dissociated protein 1
VPFIAAASVFVIKKTKMFFFFQIIELCLKYVTYDPNYNYEADDGENGASMDTEEQDDDDSEEYSDDDDMSWKVRRSAAKCLESVISTRHELLEEFYTSLSPSLIARFKEREENVKSDIFHCFIALLKATRPIDDMSRHPDSMEQVPGPMCQLQAQVPAIVKAVQPLMREKSVKTRQDCFLLLRELLNALPGALSNHIDQLMAGIHYSLNDKNSTSNMKIDALGFVYCMLNGHNPQVWVFVFGLKLRFECDSIFFLIFDS